KISISGRVQGVGFRPFVHALATDFNLTGTVSNNEEGVLIIITGPEPKIKEFYAQLISFPPPVSRIKKSSIKAITTISFEGFQIIPSKKGGQLNVPLTPDFAICDDCKNDIQNNDDRRYAYPFTTCVNCGPRWAITRTFPFERSHTSINDFPMCKDCEEEYTDVKNRRFHSQTNTCPKCGIHLYVTDNSGEAIPLLKNGIFEKIIQFLEEGKIIGIKNTSGFLLCCNSENKEVVKKLRIKKNRPSKPFAVLFPSKEHVVGELQLNNNQIGSLQSTERPINIVSLRDYSGNIAIDQVAPGLNQLGIMLPYSGILQLVSNKLKFPIVATSGNIHGSPIISGNEEAMEKLKGVADYFVLHNLSILHPQDDSVVKFSSKYNQEVIFRRARGYAPNYITASLNSNQKILALGAHLKSSVAFYPNEFLYISPYLGNLDNYDVYERFNKTAKSLIGIFEQKPNVVLVDSHPAYQSTLYGKELAEKYNLSLIKIQHHKAHFAAILSENDLFDQPEKVLGVVWDGTGYGEDGQIWGGEFFEYCSNKMERIYHFEYFDWLAGDKMAKEPRLSLLALADAPLHSSIAEKFTEKELTIYESLKRQNKLKTASVGRLLDAVASLLNICDINTYEGEAAILMENLVLDYDLKSCKSYLNPTKNTISPKELIKNIFTDIALGESREYIITNFLFTLANLILEVAKNGEFEHIALSGGVFQNTTLVDMICEVLPSEINLYFHKELSPNDENIPLGQIMYYMHIKN
ncbi:MAG: carbamoyltransferase HypF, partial [Maribacter sp.]|nr:carbamoyltransferase HypF [Maribacter sp.]